MPIAEFERLNAGARSRPGCAPTSTRATPPPGSLRQKDAVDHRVARAVVLELPAGRGRGRSRLPHPQRDARLAARRSASRSTPRSRGCRRLDEVYEHCLHWQEHRHDLDYEIDGVVVKVDDLAPAQRARAPRPRRRGGRSPSSSRPRSAPPAARHQGVDRAHRAGHAVRRARAGVRRRLDRRRGHAAQPGPGDGQGRATRRHGHRAQGRRRDPRGGRPGAGRAAARACAEWKFPTTCPVCGTRARAPRGRGRPPLPQRGVPGPGRRHASSTSPAAGRWTSRASASSSVRCSSSWACSHDVADIYTLDFDRLRELDGLRRHLGRQPRRPPSRRRRAARWPTCSSGSTSATSATPAAELLAAAFGHLDRIMAATADELAAVEGIGPIIAAERARRGSPSDANRARDRAAARGRGQLRGARRARRAARRWPACRSWSPARSSGYTRDEVEAAIKAHGGKSPGSVSKKTTAVVVGEGPARPRSPRRPSSASPSSTRPASLHLLETGELPRCRPSRRPAYDTRGLRLRRRVHRSPFDAVAERGARCRASIPRLALPVRVRFLRPRHRPPVAPGRAGRADPRGGPPADPEPTRGPRATSSTCSRCSPRWAAPGSATRWSSACARLRADGLRTAMITNNVVEFRDYWRAMLPLDELFDVVVDSSEVGMRKPDPRIFALALDQLGRPSRRRSIFLDDHPGNIAGAEALRHARRARHRRLPRRHRRPRRAAGLTPCRPERWSQRRVKHQCSTEALAGPSEVFQ